MASPGIEITILGVGRLDLRHLVLDVNGTLACDGQLLPGVGQRIQQLRQVLEVHLLTADTHGKQASIDQQLALTAQRIDSGKEAEQKAAFVQGLTGQVAAVGNGANDEKMLNQAALGLAVLGPEGLCKKTLLAADVLVGQIQDALDLLLFSDRLRATLRC